MDMTGAGNPMSSGPSESSPAPTNPAGGDGGVKITPSAGGKGAPPAPKGGSPAAPAAQAVEQDPSTINFTDSGEEEQQQQIVADAVQEVKLKFGDRELTPAEAQTEYNKVIARLKAADQTSNAYRDRANKAVEAAKGFQQILKARGMLSDDNTLEIETPEQIKARSGGKKEEFKVPSFLQFFENPDSNDQLLLHIRDTIATKGVEHGFALLLAHLDEVFDTYHNRVYGPDGLIERKFGEKLAPMTPFFEQLNAATERGQFLGYMKNLGDGSGNAVYPELQTDEHLARLVRIMDAQPKDWRHTQEGFDHAIAILRYQLHQEAQNTPPTELQPGNPAPRVVPAPPRTPAAPVLPVVVDGGSQSGAPRPRTGGNGAANEDGSHLLNKKGHAGGINWGTGA